MNNEDNAKTVATVVTTVAVVGRIATRLQDPNATGASAALEHKVASVLMKRLGKYVKPQE